MNKFDQGYNQLLDDIHMRTEVSISDAEKVYDYLRQIGFIDYDYEKEVFLGEEDE